MKYFIIDYTHFTKNPTLYAIDEDKNVEKLRANSIQGILDYQHPSNIIIIGYGKVHLGASISYTPDNYKTFKTWEDFNKWYNN